MAIDLLTRAKDCQRTLDQRKHNLFEVVRDARILLDESGATTFLYNVRGEKRRKIASHQPGESAFKDFVHEVDSSTMNLSHYSS